MCSAMAQSRCFRRRATRRGAIALLVRLAEKGPVLLSGDTVHFEEQFANDGVPPFNTDRAETLASMDRLTGIAGLLARH